MDLTKIEQRLKLSTKGPWSVIPAGGAIIGDYLRSDGTEVLHASEDICIVGPDGKEVMGSSEWLRVVPEDINFMANAKQDIQDLLNEIKRLKETSP
jgi:hypothetical protein